MNLIVELIKRDFTAPLPILDQLHLEPTSYSYHAIGGPEKANITVSGNKWALWETLTWLRCGINLYDERLHCVWWGYVAEVEIRVGTVSIGISLDSMANSVAVAYSSVAAGTATVGVRATTAWSSNADSVAAYGTKELLHSMSGATAAGAQGVRDAVLSARQYPVPEVRFAGDNSLSATLRCRGWFDTLGWHYYSQTATVSTVTTTQISDAVTAEGEFVTAADIDTASGISSSQYRDGDSTALSEIKELLQMGTSAGGRLLATVTTGRRLRVYAEPTSGSDDYSIDSEGLLYNQYNQLVDPHTCPVAFWARLSDVVSETASLSLIAKPSPVFIQRTEYNVARKRLMFEAREAESTWNVGGLR